MRNILRGIWDCSLKEKSYDLIVSIVIFKSYCLTSAEHEDLLKTYVACKTTKFMVTPWFWLISGFWVMLQNLWWITEPTWWLCGFWIHVTGFMTLPLENRGSMCSYFYTLFNFKAMNPFFYSTSKSAALNSLLKCYHFILLSHSKICWEFICCRPVTESNGKTHGFDQPKWGCIY